MDAAQAQAEVSRRVRGKDDLAVLVEFAPELQGLVRTLSRATDGYERLVQLRGLFRRAVSAFHPDKATDAQDLLMRQYIFTELCPRYQAYDAMFQAHEAARREHARREKAAKEAHAESVRLRECAAREEVARREQAALERKALQEQTVRDEAARQERLAQAQAFHLQQLAHEKMAWAERIRLEKEARQLEYDAWEREESALRHQKELEQAVRRKVRDEQWHAAMRNKTISAFVTTVRADLVELDDFEVLQKHFPMVAATLPGDLEQDSRELRKALKAAVNTVNRAGLATVKSYGETMDWLHSFVVATCAYHRFHSFPRTGRTRTRKHKEEERANVAEMRYVLCPTHVARAREFGIDLSGCCHV